MNSTRRPRSRKYSAMAVATNAALRRTRLGASLVAHTTTERARPAAPSASSRNSPTSRPRSPTSAMTFTSASVWRAICPISVDLPTPEPAKRPTRWPSPTVSSASSARTPSGSGRLTRRARQRIGRGAIDGPVARVGAVDRAGAVDGLPEAVEHAAEQAAPTRRSRTAGRWASPRVRADARRLAQRHQHDLVAAEADDLGVAAVAASGAGGRRRGRRIVTSSPTRTPGTDARMTRPVTSVTRPASRRGVAPPVARARAEIELSRHVVRRLGQRALERGDLGRQPRVDAAERGLDDAAVAADRLVGDQVQCRGRGRARGERVAARRHGGRDRRGEPGRAPSRRAGGRPRAPRRRCPSSPREPGRRRGRRSFRSSGRRARSPPGVPRQQARRLARARPRATPPPRRPPPRGPARRPRGAPARGRVGAGACDRAASARAAASSAAASARASTTTAGTTCPIVLIT